MAITERDNLRGYDADSIVRRLNASTGLGLNVYLLKKLGKHRPEAESRSRIDPVVQSALRIGEPTTAPWRLESQVVTNEASRRRPGCNHFFEGRSANSEFHDGSTYAMVVGDLSIG